MTFLQKKFLTTIIFIIFKTTRYNVKCDGLCSRSNKSLIQGELLKPLKIVVKLGEVKKFPEMIKFILENEEPDTEIWVKRLLKNLSPLDLAALYGFTDVVEKLMKKSDFRLPESFGFLKTPIHYAALNGHLDTVKFLVSFTDNPLDGSKFCSPIHWAARNGHLDTLKILVDFTSNPNAHDSCGQTPFHLAAKAGSLECLQFLASIIDHTQITQDTSNEENPIIRVSNGETPITVDSNGETPIHMAVQNGHLNCLKFLVNFTDNPIVQDNFGQTPIHLAANHLDCIKFLVDFTDAPNVQGFLGKTPIELAELGGHTEVVQFLEEHCKK